MKPTCHYCHADAELVSGAFIYPHRPDLDSLRFWRCAPCGAYVGCHKAGVGQGDGTRPLGRLANAELRKAKKEAHAAFDPIWKEGCMNRRLAYAWLAEQLDLPFERTHIGEFDTTTCARVVAACKTYNV